MFKIPNGGGMCRRLVSLLTIISLIAVATAFAQTVAPKRYAVELAVENGKKSIMTDADIVFGETTFQVIPDKTSLKGSTKEISYTAIKTADQSYSKKPMLSGGGAVATALLVGFIFALPFLFIKKKKHWMTVQSEKEFAVMQLGDNNFRQIVAEFETHGVKVNDLGNESKK
jgi:hypothetical protein